MLITIKFSYHTGSSGLVFNNWVIRYAKIAFRFLVSTGFYVLFIEKQVLRNLIEILKIKLDLLGC